VIRTAIIQTGFSPDGARYSTSLVLVRFKVLLFLEYSSRFSHDPTWFKILFHPAWIIAFLITIHFGYSTAPNENLVLILFKFRLGKKSWEFVYNKNEKQLYECLSK
jgi:hypothetical protein